MHTGLLPSYSRTTTHQLPPEYYCIGLFQEVIEGSNWILVKAIYNGTENDLPITIPGKHYFFVRPKNSDVTVTESWGVFIGQSFSKKLFAPWGVMNNNVGEISFLANPNEVDFYKVSF